MPNKAPMACERWDITSPDLLPHSRLYPLEPIGIGTPWVESLSGYVARLAEAHCVSTGMLCSKEIYALRAKGTVFTSAVKADSRYPLYVINGSGGAARDFVCALESLTHRSGLRYLTLLPWEHMLAHGGRVQRLERAWCLQCLQMWQAEAKPVYEPLLWTLNPVMLCTLHRQPLSFVCPACKRRNDILDPRIRPGYCSRCRQWLAPTPTETLLPVPVPGNRELTNCDISWEEWVATVLGEILAAAPRLSFTPSRDGIARMIRLCVERIADGNAKEFGRELEVSGRQISKWQLGRNLPKLSMLLALTFRLGVSLLDLIVGANDSVPQKFFRLLPPQVSKEQFASRKLRKPSQRMNSAEVLLILQAALNENPPPSFRQVANRATLSTTVIYQHFPTECRTIIQRFASYRKNQNIARKTQAQAEIREVARQLHAKGITITLQHLRPLVTMPYYTYREEGRALLRQIREELGAPRLGREA